jgi:hypothetical protein
MAIFTDPQQVHDKMEGLVDLDLRADDGHLFRLAELNTVTAPADKTVQGEGDRTKMTGFLPAVRSVLTRRGVIVETGPANKVWS